MSLNELIRFAEIDLDNLEQIAMKETDEGNKLVIIPFVYSYNADMNENFEFCDTVNSCEEIKHE